MDKDQLITKQQLEIEDLKKKVCLLQRCIREASDELDNVERWINPKCPHIPKPAINAINKTRWLISRVSSM
jgi:hypothetical protein